MHQEPTSISELIARQRSGYSLEQRFYTDPDVYQRELDRIVFGDWLVAGHESELPEPGDFKVFDVAGESAIIVRGSDGGMKAFANVCRHRGSRVCLDKRGSVRRFECPYHGWMYDVDGNLVAARNMPEDFDRGEHNLRSLALDTLGGLLLLCFDQSPPSLAGAKRDMAEPFELLGFGSLKVAAHKAYPIAANWKLAVENYCECYHCATAHPEYARMHTLMLDSNKRERVQGKMRERMAACGMRDIVVDHTHGATRPGETSYHYSRTALFKGYQTGSRDGLPVAPLLGKLTGYDGGASDIAIGPLSFMLAYSDHVVMYVFTPVDIKHCRCDVYWLVRANARAGNDYDVDELTWLWDITTLSDKEIIVNNWKGVQSRYYQPGPFSNQEDWERSFVDWYLATLAADRPRTIRQQAQG
jgi:Rieske 2Fe-2S family protein